MTDDQTTFPVTTFDDWVRSGRTSITVREAVDIVIASGWYPVGIDVFVPIAEDEAGRLEPDLNGPTRITTRYAMGGGQSDPAAEANITAELKAFFAERTAGPRDPFRPRSSLFTGAPDQGHFEILGGDFEEFAAQYRLLRAETLSAASGSGACSSTKGDDPSDHEPFWSRVLRQRFHEVRAKIGPRRGYVDAASWLQQEYPEQIQRTLDGIKYKDGDGDWRPVSRKTVQNMLSQLKGSGSQIPPGTH